MFCYYERLGNNSPGTSQVKGREEATTSPQAAKLERTQQRQGRKLGVNESTSYKLYLFTKALTINVLGMVGMLALRFNQKAKDAFWTFP